MLNTNGTVYDSYSTINRDNITDPKNGLVIFNTDNRQLEINLGTPEIPNWQPVVPAPEDLCDLTLTPLEVTLGSLQTYTLLGDTSTIQPDYGVIQLSPPVVIVPGVVELSRDAGGGQIYNAVNESTAGGPYDNDWPSDTEWNSVFTDPVNYGFADLTNVKNRTYNNFVNANNGFGTFPGPTGVGNNVVGLELVCHVISTDQYFKFTFTSWDKGNNPPGGPWGGFVVDVQEITVSDPCEITFSDGTTQTTAPVPTQICGFPFTDALPTDTVTICRDNGAGGFDNFSALVPTDTNTVSFPNVAFVDQQEGNNLTAVVGDANKPFFSMSSAMSAADIVIIKPGVFSQSIIVSSLRPNKHIIAMDGVTWTAGGLFVSNGANSVKFTGMARIDGAFHNGIQVNTTEAVDIVFECKAVDNSRTIMFTPSGAQAKVKYKADYVRSSGVNGGAYCVRMYGTAEAIFDVKYYIETQYCSFHGRSGFSGKLIVNCPEVRIINPFTSNPYSNAVKNVLWLDSVLDAEIVFNGNVVDKYTTNRTGGVINSANITNATLNPTVTINGEIRAGNTQCVYNWYRSAHGTFIFNGDIINTNTDAGSQKVPVWTQMPGWGGAADQKIIIKGNIQANARSVIGMGKKFYVYSQFIYNADVDGSGGFFFKSNTGSAQQTEVYFYNTKFELGNAPGTSEIVLGDASLAGNIVNAVDVKGTEPTLCSVVVDAWAGYTQLVGLITPKI